MAMRIADTATVDPNAQLADEVEIGPYCVIGPDVRIGRASRLIAHVCLFGSTTLGEANLVGPFSVIGADPSQGPTGGRVEIGDGNTIRESCSIEAGAGPSQVTRLGSRNQLGPLTSISQGASIGDDASLGSAVRLGAGSVVGSFTEITSGVDVHALATIGAYSFVGGPSRIVRDVPPYLLVDGSPPRVRGVNIPGLKRQEFSKTALKALREAHRLIFRAGLDLTDAGRELVDHGCMTPEVIRLLEALQEQRRGRHGRARDGDPRSLTVSGASNGHA